MIVAFWICVWMLTIGRAVVDPWSGEAAGTAHLLAEGFELALWMILTPVVFGIATRLPLDRDRWAQVVGTHLVIGLVVASVVNGLDGLGRLWAEPGVQSWQPIQDWINLSFAHELAVYLAILAAGFARNYFYRSQERERQAAQLEAQLAEARLEALRMQINPHFLFNTLHAISSMVEDRPGEVHRMVARLSELLRYALDSTATHEVPLEQEIGFLRRYIEIQQIRFEDRLASHIDIEPGLSDALVPSLILQPVVENAITHGASQTSEQIGRVWITAELEETDLLLRVQDNGPGLEEGQSPGDEAEGIGLENTRARLANLYGEAGRLHVSADEERGGLRVEIAIPYHTSGDTGTVEIAAE